MIRQIVHKNRLLFWLGASHLLIFLLLLIYFPFNNIVVLGINSVVKPMKFALSIWIYSWTMALILHHLKDMGKVRAYSWMAVIVMSFEQLAITTQALRGELSHFNINSAYGIILFSLMGVFILTLTLWTAYITYIFCKQQLFDLSPAILLSIRIGLIYFVMFSLFGGYISGLPGHTVGAADGTEGLWFLNWSKTFGDLRVAHFFGIHSLQIIPLFAMGMQKYSKINYSVLAVWSFSIIYLAYVLFTLAQGVMGMPFIRL
ncbi:MAG: hypothetical protein ACKVOQ_15260 [Cyclobacteriaceae bacterium]